MSRILLSIAIASLFVAGCQTKAGGTDPGAGANLLTSADSVERLGADLAEQHRQGLLKGDTAALDKLWADELTFVNARGDLLSKSDRLNNLNSGATTFASIDLSNLMTHSTGERSCVTTCRVVIKGKYSGSEGSGDYRVTFVWAQPHGRWQLVALQMTRIVQ